jgi:peptide/nickel transport system permease protein
MSISAALEEPEVAVPGEMELKRLTPGRLKWLKFRDHKVALWSLLLLVLFYLVALFCEFVSPANPWQRDAGSRFAPPQRVRVFHDGKLHRPFVYSVVQHIDPDSRRLSYSLDTSRPEPLGFFVRGQKYQMWSLWDSNLHLFGTVSGEPFHLLGADRLGRDLLSRIFYGSRISLSIGLVGVLLSLVLGVIIGGISGYYGGWIDSLIQRVIEVLRSFPTIPLWLALSAAIPATVGDLTVYFCMTLILALIGWTGLARVVRGKFLALREEDYVLSARVAGVKEMTIIRRHLVPAFTSHLIVHVTLAIPGMILAETSLSFLRLGLRPPTISWGVLLQDAQNLTSLTLHPWLLTPAIFVIVAVLAYNFVGDGLRDAADPYRN